MADSRPEGRALGPLGAGRAMAEGVVHQIVNGVVRELDVDAIVSQVDIDALLERVDVDAIVKRVDIEDILDRVDIDAIVKRIDLQALVADLGIEDIVRQSTGVLASDSVKLVRVRTKNGDVLLSRFIDRLLHRTPRYPELAPAEAPSPAVEVASAEVAS